MADLAETKRRLRDGPPERQVMFTAGQVLGFLDAREREVEQLKAVLRLIARRNDNATGDLARAALDDNPNG